MPEINPKFMVRLSKRHRKVLKKRVAIEKRKGTHPYYAEADAVRRGIDLLELEQQGKLKLK